MQTAVRVMQELLQVSPSETGTDNPLSTRRPSPLPAHHAQPLASPRRAWPEREGTDDEAGARAAGLSLLPPLTLPAPEGCLAPWGLSLKLSPLFRQKVKHCGLFPRISDHLGQGSGKRRQGLPRGPQGIKQRLDVVAHTYNPSPLGG